MKNVGNVNQRYPITVIADSHEPTTTSIDCFVV